MMKVEIYTLSHCPFCQKACHLLKRKGVEYLEHVLDDLSDDALHERMLAISRRQTVPEIFINGRCIGGWDEMHAMDQAGELDSALM